MKNIVKVIIALLIVMSIFSIYVWGTSYLDWRKESLQKPQEIYENLGNNYQIGKHNKVNKICNKNEEIGCLNGEIKGYKQENGKVYLYLYLYRSSTTGSYNDEPSKILGYNYHFFFDEKNKFVEKEFDIPKFGYLSNNDLKFYSENDLKILSKEQQKIFKELEENPTVIINGVDYAKE